MGKAEGLLQRCLAQLPNLRDPNGFPGLAGAVRGFLRGKATDQPCVHCTYAGADLYEICGRPDCENAKPPESETMTDKPEDPDANESPMVFTEVPPPPVDCPEHGEQVLFSMSSHTHEEWTIEFGCAKCYAEAMREIVQARMNASPPES